MTLEEDFARILERLTAEQCRQGADLFREEAARQPTGEAHMCLRMAVILDELAAIRGVKE